MSPHVIIPHRRHGRPPSPIRIGFVASLLLVVMAISWFGMNRARHAAAVIAPTEADPLASLVIPEFSLMDQNGEPRTRDIFKNRWTILAFTFSHCTTICPIMHAHLVRLQGEMKDTPLRIVTISVDPAHDTPEALRAYAEKIGADLGRWSFLTGDAPTIQRMLVSLRFSADADPSLPIELPGGGTMNNILHPSKLLLIGPDATVRAMENGLQWSGSEALLKMVRQNPG